MKANDEQNSIYDQKKTKIYDKNKKFRKKSQIMARAQMGTQFILQKNKNI